MINKPAGLAVHGGSGVKIGLIEALRQVREDLDFLELVHRLDRDTSGCLLLAKSRPALLALNDSLKKHQMDKQYLALVGGRWPARRDFVSARLERYELANGERRVRVDPPARWRVRASPCAKPSPGSPWSKPSRSPGAPTRFACMPPTRGILYLATTSTVPARVRPRHAGWDCRACSCTRRR